MSHMIYSGSPTVVLLEASLDTICALHLDTMEGEQYDHVTNVIRVERTSDGIELETVRSMEAMHRGELDAGRAVRVLPPEAIDTVTIHGRVHRI